MKKLILMVIVATAFMSSCNSKNENKVEEVPTEIEAVEEVPLEKSADEEETLEAERLKAEIREDSLKQVKEHGHVH